MVRPPLADWGRLANYQFPPPAASKHFNEAFRPRSVRHWPAAERSRLVRELYGWFDLFERRSSSAAREPADRHGRRRAATARVRRGVRFVERNLAMLRNYIALGVNGVFFGDDWGTRLGRSSVHGVRASSSNHATAACSSRCKTPESTSSSIPRQSGRLLGWPLELGVNVLNMQHSILPRARCWKRNWRGESASVPIRAGST